MARQLKRTESERLQPLIRWRQETKMVEAADGLWSLQETEVPYDQETGPKSAPCDYS
jgi:hypothetical protein